MEYLQTDFLQTVEYLQTEALLHPSILWVCGIAYGTSFVVIASILLYGKAKWAREETKRREAAVARISNSRRNLSAGQIIQIQAAPSLFREFVRWFCLIFASISWGLLWPFAPRKVLANMQIAFLEI